MDKLSWQWLGLGIIGGLVLSWLFKQLTTPSTEVIIDPTVDIEEINVTPRRPAMPNFGGLRGNMGGGAPSGARVGGVGGGVAH